MGKVEGYKIRDQRAMHFVTFTIVEWVDVFTRNAYCQEFIYCVRFCQKNKGLKVHAWCIMSNHVHLIVSALNNNLSSLICDIKKFTSRRIVEQIRCNIYESRRAWMLRMFCKSGEIKSRLWQPGFHPIEIWSDKFINQKLNYVHDNPVVAGIVDDAPSYVFSSARDYEGINGLLEIDYI